MKQISIIGVILAWLLMPSSMQAGNEDCYTFPICEEPPEKIIPEKDGNKHRVPPRPMLCKIDLNTAAVFFEIESLGKSIVTYEIWNYDASFIISTAHTKCSFIENLRGLDVSDCQVRFITSEVCYTGYIRLD